MAYVPRTSKYNPTDMVYYDGINDYNKYWYTTEYSTDSYAICLPNCTTYAMGRCGEIAGKSVKGWDMLDASGYPDASRWWAIALWEKSYSPSLGAVACWVGSNHVAVVEVVGSNDDTTMLSMSGYVKGTGTRTYTNPGTSSSWYFRYVSLTQAKTWYGNPTGYLVNPYAGGQPVPTTVNIYTVASPSSAGYVTGGGSYNYGTSVTLSATAYSGHTFIQWSTGQTSSSITVTANQDKTYTAYFDTAPPTPTPEAKVMTLTPSVKNVTIAREGAEFNLLFHMTGTPYSGEWKWYPDVDVRGEEIELEQVSVGAGGYPWVYTEYTGQDGNQYIETNAEFKVKLSWTPRLSGRSGAYTVAFTRYNTAWTVYDLQQILTINYQYEKGGAVLFLRYDGGAVEIR